MDFILPFSQNNVQSTHMKKNNHLLLVTFNSPTFVASETFHTSFCAFNSTEDHSARGNYPTKISDRSQKSEKCSAVATACHVCIAPWPTPSPPNHSRCGGHEGCAATAFRASRRRRASWSGLMHRFSLVVEPTSGEGI